ncbi:hypothetical protein [Nocardioides pinisoli]|uniref:Uncharacterized protein n=1 Tax=Nocardioides pinisoli TaxID=2950279 RepID=A0ABT1KUQ4_9ACTN|nr:hypothetical protein [Nocardioides pinisoli]MCP3420351.1 hypothetical protein [Nocardioides pinisoli]
MQASEEVVAAAGGDAYAAALNHFNTGGNCMVTTVQLDGRVFVVGQDDHSVLEYTLSCWNELDCEEGEPVEHHCHDAMAALAFLDGVRRGSLVWQCGGCDAWIHTAGQPHIGVLPCHHCPYGGVDFTHARRHVGLSED